MNFKICDKHVEIKRETLIKSTCLTDIEKSDEKIISLLKDGQDTVNNASLPFNI